MFVRSAVDGPSMDVSPAESWLDVDVDLGFAIFFFFLLCVFLLVSIVRCSQIVLDPYSAVSISIYQEEQEA
ncbi:cortexin domain-containing 1 protein-like [Hemibagrus wyckioides]|uniref:cortexin domain-containing 1 protein-like n=1 Tax=Hemibagrus wyckioides TaxID=337641 RepID=UPI00266BE5E7|nr:cortexin domain-containing 1 protein-like [Hemibagrus wyckioides]